MNEQKTSDPVELEDETKLPVWHRPTFAILDVESGTVTTSGPHADGNGSTS
ncbi:hypothetical protein [Rhodospirillum rubrum]|uniref:hypothetical protein n=1 Tax=Rhodospirillum rubrum TaxID=1085 RepID=UPI000037A590|nr:hypothetical protein [Rhodospirillum rubrum]AEO49563.1 hypothetical protein F11_15505 [Rhodospirillum rubrum F11]QXG79770.1 hypothetical protein KUL73_15615 [Rhodospirillum rubrum]